MFNPGTSASPSFTESHRPWLIAIVLALLFHLLLFQAPIHFGVPAPTRVDVQRIDPDKLAAIKKKWADQMPILIDKDKARPKENVTPKDPRFMSDRNIRVEKEQRAKTVDTLPEHAARKNNPAPESPSRPETRHHPALGNLGIPFRLEKKRPENEPFRPDRQAGSAEQDRAEADQDVGLRDLPEGAENLLNAQESVYYSFYERVTDAIAPVWRGMVRQQAGQLTNLQPGDYVTDMEAVLDADGKLVDVKEIQPSGITGFDQAATECWRKVGEFMNPPKGLLDNAGELHIAWKFTVRMGEGLRVSYGNPERIY